MRRWRWTAALVAPWIGACYGYYQPAAPSPVVGTHIALTLNDAGSASLARLVGPAAEVLEGELTQDTGASVVLAMTRVRQHNGAETTWKGEAVTVDKSLVSSTRERRFSRGRTAAAATLVTVALTAAVKGFAGNGAGKLPGAPPPGGGSK